jgi:membrane-associated phospholipid phosphatase
MTGGANAPRLMTGAKAPRLRMTGGARLGTTLAAAAASAVGCAVLGSRLDFDEPTRFDRRVRRFAQRPALDGARVALEPLFPVGLPGGYITIAYATRRWLHRRDGHGAPVITAAAWLGWLVHRAVKLGYFRERPRRPGVRRRTDSYPSGHTTGATALAVATALVLQRNRLISRKQAGAMALGAASIMGVYRVIADDHWATDVIGGWLLGSAIGLTCYAALGEPNRRAPRVVPSNPAFRELESTSKRSRRRDRRERPSFSA